MSSSLLEFLKVHPFLGILIIVFMVLPMIGAVVHIILKALGKRGIDNSPSDSELSDSDEEQEPQTKP